MPQYLSGWLRRCNVFINFQCQVELILLFMFFIFHIQSYGKEVADLEEQMAAAKLDLKLVNFIKTLVTVSQFHCH